MLKPDLVHLISAGYAAFLQPACTPDSVITQKVANPDNIRYSEAMRTLFIGEDSGNHLNNFVWAYNIDSKALARIFSAPIGAENTGLNVFDDYTAMPTSPRISSIWVRPRIWRSTATTSRSTCTAR